MSSLSGPNEFGVFTVTFDSTASKDHRLSKRFFQDIHKHLDIVEAHGGDPLWGKGSEIKSLEDGYLGYNL